MIYAISQGGTPGVADPHRHAAKAFSLMSPVKHLRDMLFGLAVTLLVTVAVHADESLQDWLPDVVTLPDDAEILTDRAIGSTIRMFSIATGADPDTLFADWEQSLSGNGYPVSQRADDLLDRSIEFSGPGISNAKIIVSPSSVDGRTVIEFDATLD